MALSTASAASANSTLTVMANADRAEVRVAAMAGKVNDFQVQLTGSAVAITDPGDPIDESAAECSGGGTNSVSCTFPVPIGAVILGASDLDDSIRVDAPQGVSAPFGLLSLVGGDGGDEITVTAPPGAPGSASMHGDDGSDPAGDGGDVLTGGGLDDFLSGNGGVDVLVGGEGDDQLTPGPGGPGERAEGGPGDDGVIWGLSDGGGKLLDGGDGADTLFSFNSGASLSQGSASTLTVDLAAGTAIQTAGGNASVSATGFETFDGLGPLFMLSGTDGPNRLATGDANDVIAPRAGPDRVVTRGGADRVAARDGFSDRIQCGPGVDTVEADQLDELVDCEDVQLAEVLPAGVEFDDPVCRVTGVRRRVPRRRFVRGLRPEVECNEIVELEARLTVGVGRRRGELVTVRAGQLVLAESALPLGDGARRVLLRPARRLRRVLGRRFVARVEVVARDSFGNRSAITRAVRVR